MDVFKKEVERVFYNNFPLRPFNSWMEAFEALTSVILKYLEHNKPKTIVIFLDELPWLATHKSKIIQAIDHYWNTVFSTIGCIKFIVCGSAASWIINNLINAKGGLHNRITQKIHLQPFKLFEVKEFLESNKVKYTNSSIIELYLAIGGVPLYLQQVDKNKSVSENISNICFNKKGLLNTEFKEIFQALFSESEKHYKIMHVLSQYNYGLYRQELLAKLKLVSGGQISKWLKELEEAGFITSFIPFGMAEKNIYYRITDPYHTYPAFAGFFT